MCTYVCTYIILSCNSSLKPDLLEKLTSLIAIHGPLPVKPLRSHLGPGGTASGVSVHMCTCTCTYMHVCTPTYVCTHVQCT